MKKTSHLLIITFFCIAFGFSTKLSAQVLQYGKVTDAGSHGKALTDVFISIPAATDSHPTASDSQGEFRIDFREHHAGDKIYGLRAKKKGYEVDNIHVTRDGWILTEHDTLRIVMAPIGKLTEARMKYYDILVSARVTQYDATVDYLDGQLAKQQLSSFDYQYWKQRANDELNESYAMLDDQADQLARYSLENDTEAPLALVADDDTQSVLDELQVSFAISPSIFEDEYKASVSTFDAFSTYGFQYADACYGLALMFEERNQPQEAVQYLLQALHMFEALQSNGYDYLIEIQNIKAKLKQL